MQGHDESSVLSGMQAFRGDSGSFQGANVSRAQQPGRWGEKAHQVVLSVGYSVL